MSLRVWIVKISADTPPPWSISTRGLVGDVVIIEGDVAENVDSIDADDLGQGFSRSPGSECPYISFDA